MKILILKPSSLGDIVHALPVLRLLKLAHPTAAIYWWIDTRFAPLLEGDPDLAGIIRFERRRWSTPGNWGEMWRSIRALRRHRFDWVIDLQSLARSGAFAWLANGGLLIGLDEVREGARGFYDLAVSRPSPRTHAVDWYLRVLPRLGVPVHHDFTWLPERKELHTALRQRYQADRARWIAFQPGARWDTKRWPLEHFIELARLIAVQLPGYHISILGGAEDQSLGAAIAAAVPERCLDLTGQLTLLEMVEWLRLTHLLVTNDTGPMHVAAALGKPVVAMFGPTDPRKTGPYGQLDHVLRQPPPCAPCFQNHCTYPKPLHCLRAITPAVVLAEIQLRLQPSLT